MFVSFLMPHVDRGAGPLFHLIMLLQMSRFAPDEICFIGDDAYFAEEHVPFGEELAVGSIRFTCVSQERFRAYRKCALPFASVAGLYEDRRDHLDAFKALLTTVHRPLRAAIASALDQMAVAPESIESFLTWSNCPTLSALAAELGKPVIHNELGPLRAPAYQDTVYFDFQGVNGNTTPATAWQDRDMLAAQLDGMPCLTNEELRKLLYCGELPSMAEPSHGYRLGVALQVEDDSNTLAYGRGYDAIRLLYHALRNLAPEQVLVRSHPGAHMSYRGGLGECDTSPTSLVFLQRISHLVTINSSVAAEAALWGLPYTVLGDTPFSVLSRPLDAPRNPATDAGVAAGLDTLSPVDGEPGAPAAGADRLDPAAPAVTATETGARPDPALNALLLGYLVPGALLYDPDYYRWRLAGASLRDCFVRHLEVFKRTATHAHVHALPSLGAQVPAAALPADSEMPRRNAALWSATRSLSRSADSLQRQVEELELRLAAAIAERDKNWEERCWFQTKFERAEAEMQSLQSERDTLRFAVSRVAAFEALTAEAQALRSLHGEVEQTLSSVHRRLDEVAEELGRARARQETAEAQSAALLDELHQTQRERIQALSSGTIMPLP